MGGKILDPGPNQCHPRVGSRRPAAGCLPLEVLQRAANAKGIKGSGAGLRKALEKALGVQPVNEHTFLMKLPGISDAEKQKLQKEWLRPPLPLEWKKDPDMWLDSINIADVMNQYEEAFPKFEFMGPFPIDFAAPNPYGDGKKCLMDEVCEFRVQKAREDGVEAIGIVYNLDPHFKGGSHWVANFVDLKHRRCMYFDSYGMAPPKQIEKFMKWLTGPEQDPSMELMFNSRRHQFKNTECGMYCLYFIIRMLAGDKFVDFSQMKPNDEDMIKKRKWIFST